MTIKKMTLVLLSLWGAPLLVNADAHDPLTWHDLSDPRSMYSSVSVAGGNNGVNLSANYAGYLNGQYKHKITVESINDLDYYNFNYMLLNASTNSGFVFETSWDRNIWDIKDVNDSAIGVFSKIYLLENQLNLYPKLNLGLLWGEDVKSTTYIKIDLTARYNITNVFWVGITPTYSYSMQGIELEEWDSAIDAGIQLSSDFAFAAHVDNNYDYWINVTFTF